MAEIGPVNVPPTVPSSTYRLQFRNGMTFDRAIGLIPHWMRLGITHLYASPVFSAVSGSTHGYDITDCNEIEPDIGGMEGFMRLSAALREAGLGLILDIVPNHMAASLENPWWASVVKWGSASPYAHYFDTDWDQKLTLPVLTGPIEEEIAAGAGRLVLDRVAGTIAFDYRGTHYPLHPGTYGAVFKSQDIQTAIETLLPSANSDVESVFHESFRRLLSQRPSEQDLLTAPETVSSILDRQPWKLTHWREAANGLSYRRFFEITGLVGLRVEDPEVFNASHRLIIDLVTQGMVQGLRVDHVDGLADPAAYLQRLREAVGPEIYLVVEKILEGDEQLPRAWPISGTTGYEFITAVADVLTDHENDALNRAWAALAPDLTDPHEALRKSKRLLADVNFRGEVSSLERLAASISRAEGKNDPAGQETLAEAVRELVTGFPVYRTYAGEHGLDDADRKVIADVFAALAERHPHLGRQLAFLGAILTDQVVESARSDARRFRTRLQHLTGPVLAKSLEDTFFYRYNRLIALNEVGGDPIARHGGIERFHNRMKRRAETHPLALTATSTHDTKRGEDARTRLYALSEAPEPWIAAVDRWRGMHRDFVVTLSEGLAPEPATEWLIYQALAGVLPLDFDPSDRGQLAGLRERFLSYLEKALREAKLRTNWSDVDEAYEDAVKTYAGRLLSPGNAAFLEDFRQTLAPYAATGVINSLSQTLLKLTAPGVPDIYQGCEGFDFSLVDPDNRRLPDFTSLAPPDSEPALTDPVALKSWLSSKVLALRLRYPDIFTTGEYVPIEVEGRRREHVIAFARRKADTIVIVAVPRLVFAAVSSGILPSADYWEDTSLVVAGDGMRDAFHENGEVWRGPTIPIAELFRHRPFALLLLEAE